MNGRYRFQGKNVTDDLVLWMERAGEQPSLIGGKARNLFVLHTKGVPVPQWFCITAKVFDRFTKRFRQQLDELLAAIDYGSTESISAASKAIQDLFLGGDLPEKLWRRVAGEIERMGRDTMYAVRSSALGEDSETDSFAGQLTTSLFVSREAIGSAIKRCWASAYGPGILAYSHRRGLNASQTRVAVVVQEMVASKVSGIMFMANPNGNLNEIVVTAGCGLGEGVVSGRVETDTYYYDQTKDSLRTGVKRKMRQIVFNAEKGSGTIERPVASEDQRRPALEEDQVLQLIKIGQRIGTMFDHYQDVEWAMDRAGEFHILQTRPITTIPKGERVVFDNRNIAEGYPGMTSPLTFSLVREIYEINFGNTLIKAGVPRKTIYQRSSVFKNLIGYIDGRIYYNLTNWYRMFSLLPVFDRYITSLWDEMIISERDRANQRQTTSLRLQRVYRFIVVVARLIWHFTRLDKGIKAFKENLNRSSKTFWGLDHDRMDSYALCTLFQDMKMELLVGCEIPILNDLYAMAFCSLVQRMLKGSGVDNVENTFNELLCGETGMESVEPVRAVVRMAERVRSDPELFRILSAYAKESRAHNEAESSAGLDALLNDPGHFDFAAMLKDYLEKYGFRSVGELKLEEKSYADDPRALVRMILRYVPMKMNVGDMERREQEIRRRAEERVFGSLRKRPFTRRIFYQVLKYCRRSVRYREGSRLDRARAFGMVRRLFNRVGADLSSQGVISASSDIFYLTADEILGYVTGSSANPSLKKIVDLRKECEDAYKGRCPAERIVCHGAAYLNRFPQKDISRGEEFSSASVLKGTGCSPGVITAEAVVVKDPAHAQDVEGRILVAETTEPGWVFLLVAAAGLIVEKGSLLCHTAIVARELGIPTIVDVEGATLRIKSGSILRMNANVGEITVISDTSRGELA